MEKGEKNEKYTLKKEKKWRINIGKRRKNEEHTLRKGEKKEKYTPKIRRKWRTHTKLRRKNEKSSNRCTVVIKWSKNHSLVCFDDFRKIWRVLSRGFEYLYGLIFLCLVIILLDQGDQKLLYTIFTAVGGPSWTQFSGMWRTTGFRARSFPFVQ